MKSAITRARNFKKAGGSKEEYLKIVAAAVDRAAEEQRWRASERAMSLADKQRIANKVWPQPKESAK